MNERPKMPENAKIVYVDDIQFILQVRVMLRTYGHGQTVALLKKDWHLYQKEVNRMWASGFIQEHARLFNEFQNKLIDTQIKHKEGYNG